MFYFSSFLFLPLTLAFLASWRFNSSLAFESSFHDGGFLDWLIGILGGEASAEGVFGDGSGEEEFFEVAGPAGLRASDPGEFEASERLAVNEGSGDGPVDVDITNSKGSLDLGDIRRAPGVEATGEGVLRSVGDLEGVVEVFGP